jgi:hypothetical protein
MRLISPLPLACSNQSGGADDTGQRWALKSDDEVPGVRVVGDDEQARDDAPVAAGGGDQPSRAGGVAVRPAELEVAQAAGDVVSHRVLQTV